MAPAGFADRPSRKLHAIGVAYDASREAKQALEVAQSLAARLHGQLTIVSVAAPSPVAAPYGGGYQATALGEAIRARTKAELDAAAEEARSQPLAMARLARPVCSTSAATASASKCRSAPSWTWAATNEA